MQYSTAAPPPPAKPIFSFSAPSLFPCHAMSVIENNFMMGHSTTCTTTLPKKSIPIFELAACAGDGFQIDDVNVENMIETDHNDADYAVRISGKSMEAIIMDGSIQFVKKTESVENG